MSQFNWNFNYWTGGVSLLSLIHQFCVLNRLSVAEFRRRFMPAATSDRPSLKTCDTLHPVPEPVEQLFDAVITPIRYKPGAVPQFYAISNRPDEVYPFLRYCRSCVDAGYHFAWQQLSWLRKCPIHSEEMRDRCACGKRQIYRLTSGRREPGDLCNCSQLRLARVGRLGVEEIRRKDAFHQGLSDLQRELAYGSSLLRLNTDPPDAAEYVDALRLTRFVVGYLSLADMRGGSEALEMIPMQGALHRFQEWREQLFARFYDAVDQLAEDGHAVDIARNSVAFFEMHLLGRKAKGPAQFLFQEDERAIDRDALALSCAVGVMAFRLIRNALDGNTPTTAQDAPSMNVAAKKLGRPVALLVRLSDDESNVMAFAMDETAFDLTTKVAWIDDVARFLVTHEYYSRFKPVTLARKLDAAEQEMLERRNCGRSWDLSVDERQMPLFPWQSVSQSGE